MRPFVVWVMISQMLLSPTLAAGVIAPQQPSTMLDDAAMAEAFERDLFEQDFQAIQKALPTRIDTQFRLLLLREYLNLVAESEYRFSRFLGTRDVPIVAAVVDDSPIFKGLKRKVKSLDRVSQPFSHDEDNLLWDTFIQSARSLEQIRTLIKTSHKRLQYTTDEKFKETLSENISMGLMAETQVLQEFPFNALLLEPTADGRPVYETMNRTREGLEFQKKTPQEILIEIRRGFQTQLRTTAKKALEAHRSLAIYGWFHGTQWDRRITYFLRHSVVREKLWNFIPEDQAFPYKQEEHRVLVEAGLIAPEGNVHIESLKKEFPALVISTALHKIGFLASAAFNFSTVLHDKWLGFKSDKDGLRAGVLLGLNTFDEYRALEEQNEAWIFTSAVWEAGVRTFGTRGIFKMLGALPGSGPLMTKTIGSFLKAPLATSGAWLAAHPEQFKRLGIAAVTSIPAFIIAEMKKRHLEFSKAQSYKDLFLKPDFLADFATLISIETILAFASTKPYKGAFIEVASVTTGSALAAQFGVTGKFNFENSMYLSLFVPVISLAKYKLLMFCKDWAQRGIIRMTPRALAIQKSLSFANRLVWGGMNNTSGTAVYSLTTPAFDQNVRGKKNHLPRIQH